MCSRTLKSKSGSMKKWLEDLANSNPHSGQFKFKKGALVYKANTNTNTIKTTVNNDDELYGQKEQDELKESYEQSKKNRKERVEK